MVNDKSALRKHFKQIRLARTPFEIETIDREVYHAFIQNDYYYYCQDFLLYVSGEIEIGTRLIMEYIFADIERGNKLRLLVPRCEKGTNVMHFYQIDSFDDLESGHFGILEPKAYCKRIDEFVDPMCVVPGLSFDSKGYRLGFGKGFYDRFLAGFKGITIGLCCDSCMTVGELPHDGYDIAVDFVATESGWVKTPDYDTFEF